MTVTGRFLAGALAALIAGAAAAAGEDHARQCLDARSDADLRIRSCTEAIESGRTAGDPLAALYNQRGLVLLSKDDLDRAITDFDAALRLKPQYAWALSNRGIAWQAKGELDRAVADFGAAVAANPKYAYAYSNRGAALLAKGDVEHALADFDEAVRLDPPQVELALKNRGIAWLARGDLARAKADFDAAIRRAPKFAFGFKGRGYARFCEGAFEAAAEDFAQAQQLQSDVDAALWLHLARARAGGADPSLAAKAGEFEADKWPAPLVALYLGGSSPEQAIEKAGEAKSRTRDRQLCEARFHAGEWHLLRREREQALADLRLARSQCSMNLAEYAVAGAELRRLGDK